MRNALTHEAINAFQSCMESPIVPDGETSTKGSSQKEVVVRALLASDWVQKFEMTLSRKTDYISLVEDGALDILANENSFTQDLCKDSSEIEKYFQKSLNASFEGTFYVTQFFVTDVGLVLISCCLFFFVEEYLEKQRKWAETGAVRDLEFEGDTILKTLAGGCKHEGRSLTKDFAELSAAAKMRWKAIDKKVGNAAYSPLYWKLPKYTDQKGRRVVLVSNPKFDSHESASYDLMMGLDREREEKERKERILQNELSDLMKRNSEAIASYDEILALDDEHDDGQKAESRTKEDSELALNDGDIEPPNSEILSVESSVTDAIEEALASEELDNGGDEWARAFIWQDGESIVAR